MNEMSASMNPYCILSPPILDTSCTITGNMTTQPKRKKAPTRNQRLARWGESVVQEQLSQRELTHMMNNCHTPYGEIDVVACGSEGMVFIEVKTRSSMTFGQPEDAVDARKSQHMIKSAQWYMQEHPELEQNWRVDVVAVQVNPKHWNEYEMEWFENAFGE